MVTIRYAAIVAVLIIVGSYSLSAGGLYVGVYGADGNTSIPNVEFWAKSVAVVDGDKLLPDTSAEVRLQTTYGYDSRYNREVYYLGDVAHWYFQLRVSVRGYQSEVRKILLDGSIIHISFMMKGDMPGVSSAQFGYVEMPYTSQPEMVAAYCDPGMLEDLKRLMEPFGAELSGMERSPYGATFLFRKEGGFARDSCPELAALRVVEGVAAGPIYRMDMVNGGELSIMAFSNAFSIRFHPKVSEERIAELMEEFGVEEYGLSMQSGYLTYYSGVLDPSIGEAVNDVMVEMMKRVEVVEAGVQTLGYLVED